MSARTSLRLAWAGWIFVVASMVVIQLAWGAPENADLFTAVLYAVWVLVFATVGAILAARVPANPIGWLFLGFALVATVGGAADSYVSQQHSAASEIAGASAVGLAASVLEGPIVLVPIAALLLLFPDGRVQPGKWRRVAQFELLAGGLFVLGSMFAPGTLNTSASASIQNPLGVGGFLGTVASAIQGLSFLTLLGLMVVSAIGLFRRFRRASGVPRQQLKWLASACGLFVIAFACGPALWVINTSWSNNLWTVLFLVAATSIPVATGVAVTRYRLYEIDVIVRKTLVYAALAAMLALVYLGGISLITWAFRSVTGQSSALAVTLSTLGVAAAFQPLRTRIQRVVDRRFYRRKYDAAQALQGFSSRLREQVDLDALHTEVLAVVTDTLQPSHTSLWLRPSKPKPS